VHLLREWNSGKQNTWNISSMSDPEAATDGVLDLDAFRPAYTDDPDPVLAEWRRTAPGERARDPRLAGHSIR
jgi:hypothetical protein